MRTVTIEEMLTWAFVHELPKGGGVDGLDNANSAWRMLFASSWGKVSSFAELLTVIDTGPREGGMWIEQSEPHEDAVSVGRAVAGLAAFDVFIPPAWNPLTDWVDERGLAPKSVAGVAERFMLRTLPRRAAHLVSLVVGMAVLGKQPDWKAEEPKVRMIERGGHPAWFVSKVIKDDFGRENTIEVDGRNPRSRRPVPGAYRKYEFSDSPAGDIMSRLDWQLWVAALAEIEKAVRPQLVGHRIVAADLDTRPWGGRGSPARLVPLRRAAAA